MKKQSKNSTKKRKKKTNQRNIHTDIEIHIERGSEIPVRKRGIEDRERDGERRRQVKQ